MIKNIVETSSADERRLRENERKRKWRAAQKALKTKQAVASPAKKNEPLKKKDEPLKRPRTFTETEVRAMLTKALTDPEFRPPPPPPPPSGKEKSRLKRLRQLQAEMERLGGDSVKHDISVEDALELQPPSTHLKGKGIQFARPEPEPAPAPARLVTIPPGHDRPRHGWRSRRAEAKAKQVFTELIPEALPPGQLDIVAEQVEKPQTTIHCPESIKEDGLREVRRNPEYFIEINLVTNSRVVDTFYIPSDKKKFHYKTKEYRVDEEAIYLLPTKLGLFMPTSHYKEGIVTPHGFKQTNKGITGKALSLLYMEQLYTSLLYSEDLKYNLFIVILSIACLIAYGIGCYFLFNNLWNPGATIALLLPRGTV